MIRPTEPALGARRLALAACLLWPALAAAQEQPDAYDEFALERFELSLDPDGILGVDSGGVGPHLGWGAAAWLTGLDDPLVLRRMTDGAEVGALVATRVVAGVGGAVSLWRRVQLGVAVPVVVYQRASVPEGEMPPGAEALPSSGAGDVRVSPKVRLLGAGGLELAVIPAATAPLGSADGYLRESGPTFAPELAASLRRGGARAAVNVGFRLRREVVVADRVADDEAFARAGLAHAVGARSELALTGQFVAAPGEDAVEVLVGGGHWLGNVEIVAAAGFGVGSGLGNPDWRLVAAVRVGDRRPGRAPVTAPRPVAAPAPTPAPPAPAPPAEQEPPPPKAPAGIIRGFVRGYDGAPVPAQVRIEPAGIEVTADADGLFEVEVPPGAHEVKIQARGFRGQSRRVRVEDGGVTVLNVDLRRTRK